MSNCLNLAALKDLAERLKKATGPDDGLIYGIANLIDPAWRDESNDDFRLRLCGLINARAWTDAALAMVERLLPGCRWSKGMMGAANIWLPRDRGDGCLTYDCAGEGYHDNTALAICRALVDALIGSELDLGEVRPSEPHTICQGCDKPVSLDDPATVICDDGPVLCEGCAETAQSSDVEIIKHVGAGQIIEHIQTCSPLPPAAVAEFLEQRHSGASGFAWRECVAAVACDEHGGRTHRLWTR